MIFFGPSEPRPRSATFILFALSMVRPLAVAIRDVLDFLGVWGTLRNFAAARGPKRAKNTEKRDFPGLEGRAGRSARRPNLIAC